MSRIIDTDGTPLRRTRDGDLVPDRAANDPTPTYADTDVCGEHGHYGFTAARCPACWSEIKGGDRPRRYLGRIYDGSRW